MLGFRADADSTSAISLLCAPVTNVPMAAMEWLNYHHLLYFYVAAKEGSISAASRKLRLSQPTVSSQIRQLEENLGTPLLARAGRGTDLTDAGRTVYRYASEIFGLGTEMIDAVRHQHTGRPVRLVVGIADVLPKLLVHRFVEPALSEDLRVVCRQDRLDALLAALSTHAVDVVLADSPIGPTTSVRAFNHLLGESEVTVFAHRSLAPDSGEPFPKCLEGIPFLMPGEHTVMRRSLDLWFDQHDIRPDVALEFDDSALMKTFGQIGVGAFAAPSAVENSICAQYDVEALGRLEGVRERFYAITVERRISHPGAQAISRAARGLLA